MKLEITNPQSPLHCSVMLQERRKSGVPLTPDFCREILMSSANQSVGRKTAGYDREPFICRAAGDRRIPALC